MSLPPHRFSHDADNMLGLDKGAADLIASGSITVKHGVEPTQLSSEGIVFSDGSSLAADAVIFA